MIVPPQERPSACILLHPADNGDVTIDENRSHGQRRIRGFEHVPEKPGDPIFIPLDTHLVEATGRAGMCGMSIQIVTGPEVHGSVIHLALHRTGMTARVQG